MVDQLLVGNVVERNVTSPRSAARLPTSGFPAVQHRSKSAFARGRSDQSKAKPNEVPLVVSTAETGTNSKTYSSIPGGNETEGSQFDWRHQMSEENDRVVQSMTEDELEEAKREILERFGSDLLKRMTHARAGKTGQKSVRSLGEDNSSNESALAHKEHRNTY
jgi:RNA polymerase II-associated protein 1